MRREGKPEAVSHHQIMAELVDLKQAGIEGRAAINQRLDAGAKRFDEIEQSTAERFDKIEQTTAEQFEKIEKAVQPLTDLITAMGGEAAFKEIGEDAARGLAALAWLGKKVGRLAKWIAVVVAGCVALAAAIKFALFDFWRSMQ